MNITVCNPPVYLHELGYLYNPYNPSYTLLFFHIFLIILYFSPHLLVEAGTTDQLQSNQITMVYRVEPILSLVTMLRYFYIITYLYVNSTFDISCPTVIY